MTEPIRCVLSGSFHRDRKGLARAYLELARLDCQILSPHRLNFDESDTSFVRDVAESAWSPYELERHHLLALSQSHFLWVHAPGGYVGPSTSLEIGFAIAKDIPVFCKEMPAEGYLRDFLRIVPSVFTALATLTGID